MWAVLLHRDFIAHAPATPAGSTDDKHVVLIEMGTYAAAGHGERDHQIINTPVGERAEGLHQRGRRLVPVIHRLHQQRPVVFAQVIVAFERAMADLPFPVTVADRAAIDFAFHRQPGQFIRANGIDEISEAALEDYRAFLPVAFDKVRPVER